MVDALQAGFMPDDGLLDLFGKLVEPVPALRALRRPRRGVFVRFARGTIALKPVVLELRAAQRHVVVGITVADRDLVAGGDVLDGVDHLLAYPLVPRKACRRVAAVVEARRVVKHGRARAVFHAVGLEDGQQRRRRREAGVVLRHDAVLLLIRYMIGRLFGPVAGVLVVCRVERPEALLVVGRQLHILLFHMLDKVVWLFNAEQRRLGQQARATRNVLERKIAIAFARHLADLVQGLICA